MGQLIDKWPNSLELGGKSKGNYEEIDHRGVWGLHRRLGGAHGESAESVGAGPD